MKARFVFGAVAVAALAAGAGLWWSQRPPPRTGPPTISGAALYAATFRDARGGAPSLGRFQGRTLVLNFWATWCAPCREEMPAFVRLQKRWRDRGVEFVGISSEPPELLERFGRELAIDYPLWSGGEQAEELSRRLGNRLGVIPFTALIDGSGRVVAAKVGPYSESELDTLLGKIVGKSG